MSETKLTNPKKAFGDAKVPVSVVPETLQVWDCLGFLEGALKYGRANWRVAGVQVSTYVDALERHVGKFRAGEWADPDTQVPHLVSARACLGIILDAFTASMFPVATRPFSVDGPFLTDDRPPSIDLGALEQHVAGKANHLREIFKDKTPRHCTIADTYVVATPAIPDEPPKWPVMPLPLYRQEPAMNIARGVPTFSPEHRCAAIGHRGKTAFMCSLAKGHPPGDHSAYTGHELVGMPIFVWQEGDAVPA